MKEENREAIASVIEKALEEQDARAYGSAQRGYVILAGEALIVAVVTLYVRQKVVDAVNRRRLRKNKK
ncbi:MAG: hypothetical protein ABWY25_09575 [Paenisporosarcina sp.]